MVAFFVKKFFENADVSPFGFFRAVGKNREWGYRKGREREELGWCLKRDTFEERQERRVKREEAVSERGSIISFATNLSRDPQNKGLPGLQPRALGSKLDYFHAGITSTRLHRQLQSGRMLASVDTRSTGANSLARRRMDLDPRKQRIAERENARLHRIQEIILLYDSPRLAARSDALDGDGGFR